MIRLFIAFAFIALFALTTASAIGGKLGGAFIENSPGTIQLVKLDWRVTG
jgi:hypothetical protein